MIAIVSSSATERSAFAALGESRRWATFECETARASFRTLRRHRPRILIVRHRLLDGYSDDILAQLHKSGLAASTHVIVLLEAGAPSALEVRQLTLGAECVLRSPVRTDVLAAYIAKYLGRKSTGRSNLPIVELENFCGAAFNSSERTLSHNGSIIKITPRESLLIELLRQGEGNVVSYEYLYSEILARKFQGDTANMRVLFGKLCASGQAAGIDIRQYVQVIPKTGYCYQFNASQPEVTEK